MKTQLRRTSGTHPCATRAPHESLECDLLAELAAELERPTLATDESRRTSVHVLSSLFRNELAASETYGAALRHDALSRLSEAFRIQKQAHAARASRIAERLLALGAEIPMSSGAWATWARLAAELSAGASPEFALAVLLEEEVSLVSDYLGALSVIDDASRVVVAVGLLPAQMVTHAAISILHFELRHPDGDVNPNDGQKDARVGQAAAFQVGA